MHLSKNRLSMTGIDRILLRRHAIVEFVIDKLKHISLIEHSSYRGILNSFIDVLCGLFDYFAADRSNLILVWALLRSCTPNPYLRKLYENGIKLPTPLPVGMWLGDGRVGTNPSSSYANMLYLDLGELKRVGSGNLHNILRIVRRYQLTLSGRIL